MTHEVIFDSSKFLNGEIVNLAGGHVSLTKIEFVNEGIAVSIEAKTGEVDFFDAKTQQHLSTRIQVPLSGDEKFSEVKCIVEGEQIKLGFPKYTYKDHYPHCDGENDRWTKIIAGFTFLCYHFKNNCIVE